MKFLLAIFGTAILIFSILEYSASIKCYDCNSFYQHDCADYFDNQTVNTVDCNVRLKTNITFCRKIVQETYYEGSYHYRYIRQCAATVPDSVKIGDRGSKCFERTGVYKVKVRYCHCNDQEGCNSAVHSKYSYTIILSMLILTILLPSSFS